jgi:hypothetical protein
MIKCIKINMRLILNIIGARVLGGCYLLNRGMNRKDMEEEIGRVGMRMLMMRGGMGMINTINNIMGRGKGSMGLLLDKDTDKVRDRGMLGSVGVVLD